MQYVLCFIVQQNPIKNNRIKLATLLTKWAVSCPRCLSITVYL